MEIVPGQGYGDVQKVCKNGAAEMKHKEKRPKRELARTLF